MFKLDALDLVDRAQARMQVTDSVAGEVVLGVGVAAAQGSALWVCQASRLL